MSSKLKLTLHLGSLKDWLIPLNPSPETYGYKPIHAFIEYSVPVFHLYSNSQCLLLGL